jgi:hypothetical protein
VYYLGPASAHRLLWVGTLPDFLGAAVAAGF